MNKYKYETGGEFKEDTPKIYVADLKSYNEGRLVGQWVDLTDYDSGEEVSEKIASLMKEYSKKYHNGEETEHSIHDYENFDSSLYSEYMGEKDYDIIIDTHKISKEKGIPAEVLQSIANDFSPDDLEEFVDDRYIGEYDGDYELGENYVDNVGGIEGVSNPEFYFDYEALGRDLSINNYNEYDGHYFQNYKKGGTVKEYDLSKYAKGGEAISREKIVEVLKDELEDVLEDANQEYEGQEITGEEVEYKSRDGFIPFTDGGYEYRFFTYGNYLTGSGKSLPTNTLDGELERQQELNLEYGRERFAKEYPELVKELGEENIDYGFLSDKGYQDEAEELDEMSMPDDDSIMFEVEAFYYNPDNSRGIDGKHTIVLTGNVNMEAPYHRTGNYEDYTQDKFTFDSIEDLKEKLQKGIEKISKWFNGDNYKEGRELKMGRFAKGGKIEERVYAIDKRNFRSENLIDTFDDEKFMEIAENEGLIWSSMDRFLDSNEYNEEGDNLKFREIPVKMMAAKEYVNPDFLEKGGKIVWVGDMPLDIGGREELTEEEADRLAKEWKEKGYDDVIIEDYAKGGLTYMPKDSGMVEYMTKKPILKDERFVVYFGEGSFSKPISSSIKIAKSKRGAETIRKRLAKSEEFNNKDYSLNMQSMDSFYKEYPNLFAKGGEVKKKSDNSMLIGGLAGILLGIFLGRK